MGMDEQLRRKLILFKEENRYSNQAVADMIEPCSGQSVGRWIVDKGAYISEENEAKLRELLKDVNIGAQGIENNEKLRNVIFAKSMKKGMSFSSIADKMGKIISADELEILLSSSGSEFTPKTLSSLCAVLDIEKADLPISDEDRDKLYINAMKADMLLTEIPIFPMRAFNKTENIEDLFGDKQNAEELYWVAGLKSDEADYIGVRISEDDPQNGLLVDDYVILTNNTNAPSKFIAAKIESKMLIGERRNDQFISLGAKYNLLVENWDGEEIPSYTFILNVVKIIRDL